MKKLLAILLSVLLIFTMVACGDSSEAEPETDDTEVTDETVYPNDIYEWTGEHFAAYFKAQGILPRDLDYEPYVGYHGDDWQGTPINENMNWGFYEGDPGTFCVYMLRQGMGDCPEEEFNYWMDFLSENKSLPYEYAVFGTVTHKVENVLFFYADYTDDPEVLSVCDRAYEQFLKDTGLTPEY